MRNIGKTYQWMVYLVFAILLVSCGGEMSGDQESIDVSETKKENQSADDAKFAESAEEATGTAQNSKEVDVKIWKNKAKQQLESIQDLAEILNDSSLDADFRQEIEKELLLLYNMNDSSSYDIDKHDLDFKSFKKLKVGNQDTLSMKFKNNKEEMVALFVVSEEAKTFGESVEFIQQLKLISIKKEN
jgi:hypothetical protein